MKLAAVLVYAVCAGAVLLLPVAHVVKHLDPDAPRFTHLAAEPIVRANLRPDEAFFSSPGQFVLLAAQRLREPLMTAPPTDGVYWILPPLLGSEERAARTLSALACFLAARQGGRIVWAMMKDNAWVGTEPGGVVRLQLEIWWKAPLHVRFAVDERLYEAKDVLIARGRVLNVSYRDDAGAEVTLFAAPDQAPGCPNGAGAQGANLLAPPSSKAVLLDPFLAAVGPIVLLSK
jgi:hypothetical protein